MFSLKLKREGIRVNNRQIHRKDIDKIGNIIQHKVFGLPMLISSTDFALKKELDGDETNKKKCMKSLPIKVLKRN